jgi:hypothetical protein
MRKFHSIAALCGDGLRPELQVLFDRLEVDPCSELFLRPDGMIQSGMRPKVRDRRDPDCYKASGLIGGYPIRPSQGFSAGTLAFHRSAAFPEAGGVSSPPSQRLTSSRGSSASQRAQV